MVVRFFGNFPQLSEEDIIAIKNGYSKRELYKNRFISEFTNTIITLEDDNLELLSDLISEEILDIKIVMKPNGGMYHDKLAVLTDFDDNVVVFTGSNNESRNGFNDNYEKSALLKVGLTMKAMYRMKAKKLKAFGIIVMNF